MSNLQAVAADDESIIYLKATGTGTEQDPYVPTQSLDGGATEVLQVEANALLTELKELLPTPVNGKTVVTIDGAALATASNQTTIIGLVDGIESLLTNINSDTSLLSDIVSNSKVQADVLSLPTVNVSDNGGSLTIDGTVELGSNSLASLENITVTANTGLSQPLTDTQLRANAVSTTVTGTLPAFNSTPTVNIGTVGPLATATNQTTTNISLASIDSKTPALSSGSTPVVLPASQITALTPPTTVAITASTLPLPSGAATSALQTTANTFLSNLASTVTASKLQVDIVTAPTLNVSDGGESLTVDGTVELGSTSLAALENINVTVSNTSTEITNDVGNPIPVSGTVTANTGLTQPLTDAQLRAASVPVNFNTSDLVNALEAATLQANVINNVSVIGDFSSGSIVADTGLDQPLTDTQLRASAVATTVTGTLPAFEATPTVKNDLTSYSNSWTTLRTFDATTTPVTYNSRPTNAGGISPVITNSNADFVALTGFSNASSTQIEILPKIKAVITSGYRIYLWIYDGVETYCLDYFTGVPSDGAVSILDSNGAFDGVSPIKVDLKRFTSGLQIQCRILLDTPTSVFNSSGTISNSGYTGGELVNLATNGILPRGLSGTIASIDPATDIVTWSDVSFANVEYVRINVISIGTNVIPCLGFSSGAKCADVNVGNDTITLDGNVTQVTYAVGDVVRFRPAPGSTLPSVAGAAILATTSYAIISVSGSAGSQVIKISSDNVTPLTITSPGVGLFFVFKYPYIYCYVKSTNQLSYSSGGAAIDFKNTYTSQSVIVTPGVASYVTQVGHGYSANQKLILAANTVPTTTFNGQTFYVKNPTTNGYQLSQTSSGSAISLPATTTVSGYVTTVDVTANTIAAQNIILSDGEPVRINMTSIGTNVIPPIGLVASGFCNAVNVATDTLVLDGTATDILFVIGDVIRFRPAPGSTLLSAAGTAINNATSYTIISVSGSAGSQSLQLSTDGITPLTITAPGQGVYYIFKYPLISCFAKGTNQLSYTQGGSAIDLKSSYTNQSVTVTAGTAASIAHTAHGYSANQKLIMSAATAPGLSFNGQVFYVKNPTTNAYELSQTSSGPSVAFSSAGTTVQLINANTNIAVSVVVTAGTPASIALPLHYLSTLQPFTLAASVLPTGYSSQTLYLIANGITTNTFQFSDTESGCPIVFGSTGTTVTLTANIANVGYMLLDKAVSGLGVQLINATTNVASSVYINAGTPSTIAFPLHYLSTLQPFTLAASVLPTDYSGQLLYISSNSLTNNTFQFSEIESGSPICLTSTGTTVTLTANVSNVGTLPIEKTQVYIASNPAPTDTSISFSNTIGGTAISMVGGNGSQTISPVTSPTILSGSYLKARVL